MCKVVAFLHKIFSLNPYKHKCEKITHELQASCLYIHMRDPSNIHKNKNIIRRTANDSKVMIRIREGTFICKFVWNNYSTQKYIQ